MANAFRTQITVDFNQLQHILQKVTNACLVKDTNKFTPFYRNAAR